VTWWGDVRWRVRIPDADANDSQNSADLQSWRPLVLEDVQADTAELVWDASARLGETPQSKVDLTGRETARKLTDVGMAAVDQLRSYREW
jgi:hypothetical protein